MTRALLTALALSMSGSEALASEPALPETAADLAADTVEDALPGESAVRERGRAVRSGGRSTTRSVSGPRGTATVNRTVTAQGSRGTYRGPNGAGAYRTGARTVDRSVTLTGPGGNRSVTFDGPDRTVRHTEAAGVRNGQGYGAERTVVRGPGGPRGVTTVGGGHRPGATTVVHGPNGTVVRSGRPTSAVVVGGPRPGGTVVHGVGARPGTPVVHGVGARPGTPVIHGAGVRHVVAGPRYVTYHRVHPYHGVFVYGPRPVTHVTYVGGGGGNQRVAKADLPVREVDRTESLAVGLMAGSMISSTPGGQVYGDPGLALVGRYRPAEMVGFEVGLGHHNGSFSPEEVRSQTNLNGQVKLFAFPWSRVSPYALGGVTYNAANLQSEILTGDTTAIVETRDAQWGLDAGLGLELALGNTVALDFEGKYIGWLDERVAGEAPGAVQLTGGLAFHFR